MRPLVQLLRQHLGDDFPIDSGNADKDSPLVITARRNYAAIEHQVAKFLLGEMGLEHELEKQKLHRAGDKVVEELSYSTKISGENTWTGTRQFFFDITIGYYMIHSKFEEDQEDEEPPSEEELRRMVAAIDASTPQRKKDYDHAREELIRTSLDSQIIANRKFNRAALIITLLVLVSPLLIAISWSKALIIAFCTYLIILVIKKSYLAAASKRLTAKSTALSSEYYSRRNE